jgi:hypothetical protein
MTRARPKKNHSSRVSGARGNAQAKRSAIAAQRKILLQKRILELRMQGLSERQIAVQLVEEKVVAKMSGSYVNELLADALDGILVPEAEKLKKLELARLDSIINGHYGNAINGDVGATHAVLACVDRRNRLLGIGQETKVTSQTLGADGKPIDPVRPVINLTITRREEPPALAAPTIDMNGARRID